MKLILATNNSHKVDEFSRILTPLGIDVITQSQAGVSIEVDENADSFAGNAYLKARAVFDAAGLPTIADDSGLEVYALDNQPGIYSARYGGDSCKNDVERYTLLLKNMSHLPKEERGARFVCAIVLILSDNEEYTFVGCCEGSIAYQPYGNGGFGYDPVFLVDGKSFSELSGAEKDAISHRGNALKQLESMLKNKNI